MHDGNLITQRRPFVVGIREKIDSGWIVIPETNGHEKNAGFQTFLANHEQKAQRDDADDSQN